MKRFFIFAMIASLGLLNLAVWTSPAMAVEDSDTMTAAHIERIRSNCVDAQTTLSQLHASDGLLRVNRGQLYESISSKLMAPLNSRITLNRLDGVELVSVATEYGRQLAEFRNNYQSYEEAMTDTLRINCTSQPVSFYDSVADTRDKRKLTHESTLKLHQTIKDYRAAFEDFVVDFQEDAA